MKLIKQTVDCIFSTKQSLPILQSFHMYCFAAIFPISLIALISLVSNRMEPTNFSDIGFLLTSIFIAPFLETLIFCAPLVFFKKVDDKTTRGLMLCIFAMVFALSHFVFSERDAWTLIALFWLGLINALAFDNFMRIGGPAILITTCIHTIYNLHIATLTYTSDFVLRNRNAETLFFALAVFFYLLLNAIFFIRNLKNILLRCNVSE